MNCKRLFTPLLALAAGLLLLPAQARALSCNDYASRSVQQQRDNQRMNCGFNGAAWSMDGRAHYNWCKSGNRGAIAQGELDKRDQMLRRCRAGGGRGDRGRDRGRDDACRRYADRAVSQNQRNMSDRCGYRGGRWSSDHGSHFRWCLKEGPDRGRRENESRQRDLDRCQRPGYSCDWYANKAVEQARRNRDMNCGFSGSRWSSNRSSHLAWCRSNSREAVVAESDRREGMLNRCDGGGGRARGGSHRDACERYARQAMRQTEQERANGCGFKWHHNVNRAYQWCMERSRSEADSMLVRRQEKIDRCIRHRRGDRRGHRRGQGDCRHYANRAVEQSRLARDRGCGYNWSENYQRHYDWCVRQSWDRARDMLDSRERKLSRCRY